MTDATQAEQTTQTATSDQVTLIRKYFYESCVNKYADLVRLIKSLPINQDGFATAFHHLDTGMLWVEAIIKNSDFLETKSKVTPATQIDSSISSDSTTTDDTTSLKDHLAEVPKEILDKSKGSAA